MQTVTFIIANSGDGSNNLVWFKGTLTREELAQLLNSDFDSFASGDGIQATTLVVPDSFFDDNTGIYYYTSVDQYINE